MLWLVCNFEENGIIMKRMGLLTRNLKILDFNRILYNLKAFVTRTW